MSHANSSALSGGLSGAAAGAVGGVPGAVVGGVLGLFIGASSANAEHEEERRAEEELRKAGARRVLQQQQVRSQRLSTLQTGRRFSDNGPSSSPSALSTLATASPSAGGLNTQPQSGSKTSGTF